jgi:hypothetical protein
MKIAFELDMSGRIGVKQSCRPKRLGADGRSLVPLVKTRDFGMTPEDAMAEDRLDRCCGSVMWKFACLDEECRAALDRTAEGGCPHTSFSANAKERGAYAYARIFTSTLRQLSRYSSGVMIPVGGIVPVCSASAPARFDSCIQKIEGNFDEEENVSAFMDHDFAGDFAGLDLAGKGATGADQRG